MLVLLLIVGIISATTGRTSGGSESGAFTVCKKFVTDRLRSPGSAKFPSAIDDGVIVSGLAENRYAVSAYVDSQNGFGALVRTRFSCIVAWQSGAEYKLEDLQIKN